MIKSYNNKGYILKVDVKYPKQLHNDIKTERLKLVRL